ncbi:L-threonylcarbamoyladenylate synthase [Microgenomates group bacterium]|nr:L-threonylcarbamoyladenylate synthase [Microgenomates group bacterium]
MRRGEKITVLVTGVFDGLHAAHREFLGKAREAGEYLIVGIENDERVRELKGEGRPMFGERERARVIEKLQLADEVLILPKGMEKREVQEKVLAEIHPDILAVSSNSENLLIKKKAMEKMGGEMIIVMMHQPLFSSSRIWQQIKRRELSSRTWRDLKQEILLLLAQGEIVVFPTDTIYGVLADATNEKAVNKVMEFKQRMDDKTVSMAVADMAMAKEYVVMTGKLEELYAEKLPGAFTIISPLREPTRLARWMVKDKTVGVRIPDFPPLLDLVRDFGVPVTITSANSSGAPSAHSLGEILPFLSEEQLKQVAMMVDAGELPNNPPSTIIDATKEKLRIRKRTV